MEVYVEVPTPRHWKTPSQNVHPTPSSDLGGYGPESDRKYVGVEGLSTGKRTGNRDDRGVSYLISRISFARPIATNYCVQSPLKNS